MRTLVAAVAALGLVGSACSKSADSSTPPAPAAPGTTAPAGTTAPGGTAANAVQTPATAGTPAPAEKPHHRKHEDRHDPATDEPPPLQLAVTVAGARATWGHDAFEKVARFVGNTKASDGEDRDVWSLRDLVRTLVGPTARVTSVAGDDGAKAIDAAAWRDPKRTPLLHTTRRGTLKFRWADAAGAWGETEVKDVTRIEIAR